LDIKGQAKVFVASRKSVHECEHSEDVTSNTIYFFQLYSYGIEDLLHSLDQYCPIIHYTALSKQFLFGKEDLLHSLEQYCPIIRYTALSKQFLLYSNGKEYLLHSLDQCCPIILYPALSKQLDNVDEVIPIIHSGESANRIDVVFMGDGYTAAERERFFSDIQRLTSDMWSGITFSSYLPLFNVWALYRPSLESGIGVGGKPKNTAFGLYRDGTELRGVFTSKAPDARAACHATGVCDFPSLIGNDLFYGGLGGEFTISTASPTSGTIGLRHEFGHNFALVGEEYGGGVSYFGANSAPFPKLVEWTAWLTDPNSTAVQRSAQRIHSYAWHDFVNGPWSFNFTTDGTYARGLLKFSVSGCETSDAITVTLDNIPLPWSTTGLLDRQFYDVWFYTPLAAGSHTLKFNGTPPIVDQIRQLCSVELLEYAGEAEYKADNSYIGIYPTVASGGRIYYNSNHELCLMRNVSSAQFCGVCKENLWLQLLSRISLIDDVVLSYGTLTVTVQLNTLELAQFRKIPIKGEAFSVTWLKNGIQDATIKNSFAWEKRTFAAVGTWVVQVQFTTEEVRVDPYEFLVDEFSFTIE
jgi:hypothetical protein